MLLAYFRAFGQLKSRPIRRVVFYSLLGSASILAALFSLFSLVIFQTDWLFFSNGLGFLNTIINWGINFFGPTLALILSGFLFPILFTLTTPLFFERAVAVIEKQHYPELDEPINLGIFDQLGQSLKFLFLSLLINILAIPIYLMLLFLGPVSVGFFIVLNGYLIGKDYFEQIATRRLEQKQKSIFWKKVRFQTLLAGCINAVMMTIPIINLIAPLVGIIAMVHLFNGWHKKDTF